MVYKKPETRSVTIANGETTSGAVNLQDYAIVGLHMPAAFTGATITFQAATSESGSYNDVYDSDGNQVSASVAADRAIGLSGAEADALAPWNWVKLVSGSSEGADRTITLAIK